VGHLYLGQLEFMGTGVPYRYCRAWVMDLDDGDNLRACNAHCLYTVATYCIQYISNVIVIK